MLINLLLVLSFLASAIGAAAAALYLPACSRLEDHLKSERPSVHAENEDPAGNKTGSDWQMPTLSEAFIVWRNKRWRLDGTRTRIALIGLVAYALGMFSTIPLKTMLDNAHESSIMPMFSTGVLTLCILVVSIRSLIHNDRVSTIDLERQFNKYN